MHVLPVTLPALLSGMIDTESAKLTLQLNSMMAEKVQEIEGRKKASCFARLRLDARGDFDCLTASLERTSPEDFEVQLDWINFSMARYSLREHVAAEWLNQAVKRRLSRGRELARLSDTELNGLLVRCEPRIHSATYSTTHFQEAFLGLLAQAEIKERNRTDSNHQTLQAIKDAQPLHELLAYERGHAIRADFGPQEICSMNKYGRGTALPDDTRKVYDYRAYHDERCEGFPLFDVWGDPWSEGGW